MTITPEQLKEVEHHSVIILGHLLAKQLNIYIEEIPDNINELVFNMDNGQIVVSVKAEWRDHEPKTISE